MAANKRRCVVISAAPGLAPDFIESSVSDSDFVICADGGIDALAETNIMPDLIVGDFDSAENPELFPNTERITLRVRKNDTDTMHCADVAYDRGFREFLFLGATGGRTDHALANLAILIYLSDRGAHGVISDELNDISLLYEGENIIHTKKGTTISVIPFGDRYATLSYSGLSYPLENKTANADYPFTISNIAVEDRVTITLHSGRALLIIVK